MNKIIIAGIKGYLGNRSKVYFKKKDLKYVTLNYFKTYIKDPSNKDEIKLP